MISKTKISTAIATSAVLLGSIAPGAFANSIEITGNGAFSRNSVDVSQSSSTTVLQSNDSHISNDVSVSNDTGGNTSSFNTGGNTTIRTGDASSDVSIVNGGNTNVASVQSCGCDQGGSISVSGNGAGSNNDVDVDSTHDTTFVQHNNQGIDNSVDVNNSTGNGTSNNSGSWDNSHTSWSQNGSQAFWMSQMMNKFHKSNINFKFENRFMNNSNFPFFSRNFNNFGGNTGGNTSITTGNADSSVSIQNSGNTNILH